MVSRPPPPCATRMKLSDLIFILSVSFCAAQGSELEVTKEAAGVNTSGCYNLTQILETWRSSIMAQVKDLLLQHHETVLPDYSRIPPMSESLQTLNKEFNETKQNVDELMATFSGLKGLLGKLSSGQNVSHTSGGIVRKIRKKKPVVGIKTGISRRIRKKKPGVKTGQVIRNQPRKKARIPRMRVRLPAGGAQRNSSPRILINKPAWR